jgi:hypothetical protein
MKLLNSQAQFSCQGNVLRSWVIADALFRKAVTSL